MLTIAHRLETIIDSDWVIVMHEGAVSEQGYPHNLLSNPDSGFSKMAAANGNGHKSSLAERANAAYVRK